MSLTGVRTALSVERGMELLRLSLADQDDYGIEADGPEVSGDAGHQG
jgi:hypothetical protein